VAVITKSDLTAAVEFDLETAHHSIQSVRPGMRVFEVSAKTGAGMDELLRFLMLPQEACETRNAER
jgi:hydrogenase nickel incorporation protein HypB